jgi:nucleoside-diphosphate kinase
MKNEKAEQTLVLIKPDALKNSLTGYVLSQLSEFHTGLRFAGAKIVQVSRMLAEEHYAEHHGKIFFPALIEYITGIIHYPNDPWKRKVKAFVFQGPHAVKTVRTICGPTNPHEARDKHPGCIRALGTVVPLKDTSGNIIGERMDNLIHASGNVSDAEREIKLWFKPSDIPPAMRIYETEISKDHFYFLDGKLLNKYQTGSVCLIAPGDVVWESDMESLRKNYQGFNTAISIQAVAAKYLINHTLENE